MAAPKDENELQHLLYTAVKSGQPMAVRYPRTIGLGVNMDTELSYLPIGKSEIVRDGGDVAILAIGAMVAPALEAADELALRSIEATVINARFAKPLDSEMLKDLASRIKYMVTVEENTISGGFGSSVVSLLQESGIGDVRVKNIGLPDGFIEQGEIGFLRSKYGLDSANIVEQVLSLIPVADSDNISGVEGKAKAVPLK